MDERRAVLEAYVDQRIAITGVLDKYDYGGTGFRQWKNALFIDVYATLEGKDVDLGHMWIQHADALKDAGAVRGDRIRCDCRVSLYKSRRVSDAGRKAETKPSLSCPIEIEVIGQTIKRPVLVTPPTDLGSASAELIGDVRRAAVRAGGWDDLQRLIDVLRDPGPQGA